MSLKRKLNKKILVLAAVVLTTAVLGTWLLLSPRMEREYVYAAQESLLDGLMRDIQMAVEPQGEMECNAEPAYADGLAVAYVGYTETAIQAEYDICNYLYDGAYDCAADYTEFYTADCTSYYEYAAVIYEPIPDNAFPNAITGIGILTIESIDLRLPIAEGVDEATLRIAPGRVPQTAQIGEVGNAVIAGHRNYTFGSMFNRLGELVIGDLIQYQARNGEIMEFVVFEVAVIEPHDQVAFLQPVNDSIITLYTCTPIRTATHRLIIRAQRIG